MKCQKVMSLLTEYCDDKLSQKIRTELKDHLAQCEECKIKYMEFIKSLKLLKKLKPLH
jgi:anti-sigma factor RsiW